MPAALHEFDIFTICFELGAKSVCPEPARSSAPNGRTSDGREHSFVVGWVKTLYTHRLCIEDDVDCHVGSHNSDLRGCPEAGRLHCQDWERRILFHSVSPLNAKQLGPCFFDIVLCRKVRSKPGCFGMTVHTGQRLCNYLISPKRDRLVLRVI